MANIKKEAQRILETNIIASIKGSGRVTAADREAAAVIAARSMEAVKSLQEKEGKKG